MKRALKLFLISGSMIFSGNVAQGMDPIFPMDESIRQSDFNMQALEQIISPNEKLKQQLLAVYGEFLNKGDMCTDSIWNDLNAVKGMRDIIVDTCAGLAKFYLWMLHPSNSGQLHQRISELASTPPKSQSSSPVFQERAVFHEWVLDPSNFVHFNNQLIEKFYDLFLKTRVIMTIAYQQDNCVLFDEYDKYWTSSVDFCDSVLQEFVGTHKPEGLVDDALIKIFTLRKYLNLLHHKTSSAWLGKEIKDAVELIRIIAENLNMCSNGDFAARHRYTRNSPPTTDQVAF